MGAFFDGTLAGLHQTLADGRDNLRRQMRQLTGRDDEYRADVERAARLFEAAIAALPPMPGATVAPGAPAAPAAPSTPPAAAPAPTRAHRASRRA